MTDFLSSDQKPALVEVGVKYFFRQTLKQCHEFKNKYNNLLFNIFMTVFFCLFLGGILLYKYKGKLTPVEKEKKERQKQQYILSKIKNYQDAKRMAHQELITGLPEWKNDYASAQER
jgi:hypothetical protein